MAELALGAAAAISAGVASATAATAGALAAIGFGAGASSAIAGAIFSTNTLITLGSFAASALITPSVNIDGSPTDWRAEPNAGIPFVVGERALAGVIVHRDAYGLDNRLQSIVTVYSGAGPIQSFDQFYADEVAMTFATVSNVPGEATNGGNFAGNMWIQTSTGAQPQSAALAQAGLSSQIGSNAFDGWGSASKLSGKAHSLLTLRQSSGSGSNPQTYAGGVPRALYKLKGIKFYDPRLDSTVAGGSGSHRVATQSTYAYSENPAIAALNWCLGLRENGVVVGGIGAAVDGIDLPAFIEWANVCDQNGWKVSAVPTSRDDKHQVLLAIMQAGGARYSRFRGKMSCIVRTPRTSVVTLSADDTAGPFELDLHADRLTRTNTIIPRCVMESHNWEMVAQSPVSEASYVTADGGKRERGIDYPYVAVKATNANKDQPSQLAAYAIVDSRETIAGTVPLKPWGAQIEPGDVFTITEPGFLLDGVELLCVRREFDLANNLVRISFISESAGKHTYALGLDPTPPTAPALTAFDLYDVPAPGIAAFSAEAGSGGQPSIIISADADNITARAFIVEYRTAIDPATGLAWADADAGWIRSGQFDISTTSVTLTGLEGGVAYEVAIRYISQFGVIGDRRNLGTVTTGALNATQIGGLTRDEIDAARELSEQAADLTAEVLIEEALRAYEHTNDRSDKIIAGFGLVGEFAEAAEAFKIEAETSAALALVSRNAAAQSATNASGSASAASNSAATAANSEAAAGTSAGQASTSADQASASATDADGSASAAQISASVAASSQTAAGNSASAAAGSAGTAVTQASNAASSAIAANSSQTGAATSAGQASTSAGQASSSASGAAGSASAAASSETNASTSAGQASTSASQASLSQAGAASSATTATNAANTAAGHASTAQTAAATATSEASAASISADLSAQYGASAKQDVEDANDFFTTDLDSLAFSAGSITPTWNNFFVDGSGWIVTTTSSDVVFAARGRFQPAPGRRYRVTASWRWTTGSAPTANVHVGFKAGNADTGVQIANRWGLITPGAQNEWRTASFEITATDAMGGESWRPFFFTGTISGNVDVRSLVWSDLTASRAAGEDSTVVYSSAEEAFAARIAQVSVGSLYAGLQLQARKADGTLATAIRLAAQELGFGLGYDTPRFFLDAINNELRAMNAAGTVKTVEIDWDDGRMRLRKADGTLLFDSATGGVQRTGINNGAIGTQGIAFENKHFFLSEGPTRTAAQAITAFAPLSIETGDMTIPASEWVAVRCGVTMKASSDMFGHFNGRLLLIRKATYPTAGIVSTTLAEDTPHFSVSVSGFNSSGNRRDAGKVEPKPWSFDIFDRPPQNGGENPTAVKYQFIVTSEVLSGAAFENFADNSGARLFFAERAYIHADEAASGPVAVNVRLSNSAAPTLPTAPAVTIIAPGSNPQWN